MEGLWGPCDMVNGLKALSKAALEYQTLRDYFRHPQGIAAARMLQAPLPAVSGGQAALDGGPELLHIALEARPNLNDHVVRKEARLAG